MVGASAVTPRGMGWVFIAIDRISSVVLRGVSHEGGLISRAACNREQEGNRDTRVRQVWAIGIM